MALAYRLKADVAQTAEPPSGRACSESACGYVAIRRRGRLSTGAA